MKKTLLSACALILLGGIIQSCSKEASEPSTNQTATSTGSTSVRGADEQDLINLPGSLSTDSLALVALYQATHGDDWTYSNNWISEAPLSTWKGVEVRQVGGQPRVTALRLGANKLRGQLPAALGQLAALRVLQLQYNDGLTGQIPEELFQLEQLRSLRLDFTGLTGELSAGIGRLTKLDTLDLRVSIYDQSRWWDGDMKTAKEHRPNLKTLSGKLPKEIGNLREARCIDLSGQGFTGELPSELGQLSSLHYFAAYQCHFEGTIPASLGQLKELTYLSLGRNALRGELPSELGQLSSLRELLVSYNQLSGTIPASLGQLKGLQLLNLEHNQFSGNIPEALTALNGLYQLYLNGNKLIGRIPADLAGAQQPNLFWIDLRDNDLTGHLPARIKQYLPNDKQYAHIHGLPEYGYAIFAVSGNRLSGSVPQEYLQYPKTLKHLLPQRGEGFANLPNGSIAK